MLDIQTYLAAKSGKLPASPDMDMFSYLLGKSQASPTKTIIGVPPFTFKSNGDNLIDWSIKGSNDVGRNILYLPVIDTTVNDVRWVSDPDKGTITANGTPMSSSSAISFTITLPAGTYRFTCRSDENRDVTFDSYLRTPRETIARGNNSDSPGQYFTLSANKTMSVYFRIAKNYTADNLVFTPMIQIDDGSTTDTFESYQIGVGKRTKNLVNLAGVADRTSSGVTYHVDAPNGTITITGDGSNAGQVQGNNATLSVVTETTNLYMTGYDGNITGVNIYVWDRTTGARATKWDGVTSSSTVSRVTREVEIQLLPGHEYTINFRVNASFTSSGEILKPMLRLPDTNADFIPYGYEIPVTCGGATTDIFIGDSPLGADDTVSKTSTGVDIPTVNGSNTLTVDTYVQPSEMTITYNR